MNNLTERSPDNNTDEYHTNVERFLARRGLLVIKESREIGRQLCDAMTWISVETLILSIAKETSGDITYGVRFAREVNFTHLGDALLDFGELPEFIEAIDFIIAAASRVVEQHTDQIELRYLTNGGIGIGFEQIEGKKYAYLDLPGGAGKANLSLDHNFPELKKLVESAYRHLVTRGAVASDKADKP